MTTAPERPLDLREFQDIVDEARRLIPRYCPEWTDHNVSDPGITLIELFAWMTEMTLYQLNRVPDEMFDRFLELVGVRRLPPTPAEVDVTFYLTAPLPRAIIVPVETEVATDRSEADEPLVFTTAEALSIAPSELTALRVWRQGQGYEDYLQYLGAGRVEAPIFNEEPEPGDALYVGHAGDLAGYSLQLRIECAGDAATHIDPRDPPLVWEYWSSDRGDWTSLPLLDDSGSGRLREPGDVDPTHGLNRSGEIYVHIPSDSAPQEVDGIQATWIRVRHVQRPGQAYERSPVISAIQSRTIAATVLARQTYRIEREVLGRSDGEPDQRFQLRETPIVLSDEPHRIEVSRGDDVFEWVEVPDFAESSEQDPHFQLVYTTGEVRFGPFIRSRDGSGRQLGALPRHGDTLIMTAYRAGGGTQGNVGAGAITHLRSTVPYIGAVENYRAAHGGLDEESVDEARLRARSVVRHTEAAVTKDDYERLAEAVPGVGRAHCVIDVAPGVVRLVIVPDLGAPADELDPGDLTPSRGLIGAVSAELEERKILGTVIEYEGAPHAVLDLDAHIHAEPGVDIDALVAEATSVLRSFLHPLHGGRHGDGWPLDASVTESQIAAVLQALPDIAYVERVRLRLDGEETSRVTAPAAGLLVLGNCFVLAEPVED